MQKRQKSKIDLEEVIVALLKRRSEIRLRDIANEAGLSPKAPADCRAIQRALAKLISHEVVVPEGAARARAYRLKEGEIGRTKSLQVKEEGVFNHIPLSLESIALLHEVSKPKQARSPAGFNADFLKSYHPNKTFYLNTELRKELANIGQSENVTRPAGTYARHILSRLLIDLSWNSSRLEGNTYSLLETQRLIELGKDAEGKKAFETQMILNHKNAIEYMLEISDEKQINSHVICSIHALLSDNLLSDPGASGRLRKIAVGISDTTYIPLDNPHVLKEYFMHFIDRLNQIEDPFEQSFFSLVHLSYLQAFEDVNKRTSRMLSNLPLIKQNLRPLSFADVAQQDYVLSLLGIYEKNDVSLLRNLYVWAYKRSALKYSAVQQAMGEPNLFKLKYRNEIQLIVRTIILEKIAGSQIVPALKNLIKPLHLSENDSSQLFQIIETEIINLHDGNIARFKIRPSEFKEWKKVRRL